MQVAKTDEVGTKQDVLHGVKHSGKPEDIQKSLAAEAQEKAVSYMPSKEGLEMLQKSFLDRLEESRNNGEKKNRFSDMTKAWKIARNIMAGNIVPGKDEQFLQEYNADLYQAAKNIAMLRERGEEVDSELEDEEESGMGVPSPVRKTSEGGAQTNGSGGVSASGGECAGEASVE